MSFMNSLASNPSGSGIFGMPAPANNQDDNDSLALVNKLKDREMQDWKAKTDYTADASLRQEQRMRSLFDPKLDLEKQKMNQSASINQQEMQMKANSEKDNDLRANQELDLNKQKVGLEGKKLDQANKLSQEGIDVKTAQEKLNQQKSDQINTQKTADMQRKIDESNAKLELAGRALDDKTNSAADHLQAQKDMNAAMEERHKAEMAIKEHQFSITSDQHQQKIKELEDRLNQGSNTQTTTELDPSGNKKVVTTKRGSEAINAPVKNTDGTYTVTAPDGSKGKIPANKLDDWMKNHQSGGSE